MKECYTSGIHVASQCTVPCLASLRNTSNKLVFRNMGESKSCFRSYSVHGVLCVTCIVPRCAEVALESSWPHTNPRILVGTVVALIASALVLVTSLILKERVWLLQGLMISVIAVSLSIVLPAAFRPHSPGIPEDLVTIPLAV